MYRQKGFTYIELVIYIGIVAVVVTSFIQLGWSAVYGKAKSNLQNDISHNLRYSMKRIINELEFAESIQINNSSSVTLSNTDMDRNPTNILLENEKIKIGYDGDVECPSTNPCSLTDETLRVTELTFEEFTDTDSDSRLINITISIEYLGIIGDYADTYSTSVELH